MFKGLQPFLRKNRFAVIALLFFLLDIGYFFLLKSYNIASNFALYETIACFFLVLFFSFILQRIHTYYHSRSAITIVHLSIIMIFSFMINLLVNEYGQWFAKGEIHYLHFLNDSFYLRWFILFLILLTIVNQLWITKHLKEQEQTVKRLIDKERELVRAEISGIQQQMRPHFLFNSLNSINALVKEEPEQAREMIFALSDFLRISLSKGNAELNTLKEELDYLNLYLSIEKVRFGHRLQINVHVDEHAESKLLPALILQPIVENAIKYGVYGNTGRLFINIEAGIEKEMLVLKVENPYDPNGISASKGTGFGLSSVKRKLELMFHRPDLIMIHKENNLFRITISIPQ